MNVIALCLLLLVAAAVVDTTVGVLHAVPHRLRRARHGARR
jgi:hypothetical protein